MGGLGETSGQSECRVAAFITKTNSRGEPAAAHLVRGTSIICSSNLHELTVEGEREAASAGVHRVRAVCWPRSPGGPPKGGGLTRAIVRSAPARGSPALSPRLACTPRATCGPRQSAPPAPRPAAPRRQLPGRAPRGAALPSAYTDARPALARSLPGGAPRNPGIASPPGPRGASRFPRAARRARPGRR